MTSLFLAVMAVLIEGISAQEASQSAALARATQRGALLYAYDQAAWHGTDDMLAKLKDSTSKIGGYIVDGPAATPRLIFYDKTGEAAVYVAVFNGNHLVDGHVLSETENRTLSAIDRRMVLARQAAGAAILAEGSTRPCAPKPFNTVVLPPDTAGGPIPVYFLTPQTSTETIPFGGHYQVDVDASGKTSSIRHFTRSCLNMPTQPKLPPGAEPEATFVTHLLDPVPTEIHVFISLQLGTPVMVGIASTRTLWPIKRGLIGKPILLPSQP